MGDIVIEVSGAAGPPGPASGPLGAGSVEAVHITDDSTKQAAIRAKLGITTGGTFGSTATQGIDTYLAGLAVPADIGPIYAGVTASSADGITIDSGANFPPGVAFRRYLGTPGAPTVVIPGTQLGYTDFRGYNSDGEGGAFFYNSGSIDCVVDGNIEFGPGQTPASFLRFAACGNIEVGATLGMEMRPMGVDAWCLMINHLYGGEFGNLPSGGVKPVLHMANREPDWTLNIEGKNLTNNYGGRILMDTEGENDYFLYFASGAVKTEKFAVRGNGRVKVGAGFPVCSLDVDGPARVKSYTVATLPNGNTSGQIIHVSNEAGGAVLAYSDEGSWRRVTDRAVVS